MAPFILFWNPAISSYKLDEYRQFIADRPDIYDFNWSVWEPCFDATTGICMAGHFSSMPWEGEDWSGKGRPTYYMDLDLDHASDPDKCVILSTEELMAAIPDFDWKGGHSGRQLEEASAEKLHAMFQKAVEEKKDQIWSPELN